MNNIHKQLLDLYWSLGLISAGTTQPLPLYDCCERRALCWDGIADRRPIDETIHWSHISLPWVGKRYEEFRLVVLGVNPYEAGGLEFYPRLVQEAIEELRSGKIRVNFGYPGYRGTILWHRVGLYSATIISALGNSSEILKPYEAYDMIAFTNHIKCSPVGERSKPTESMWNNCSYLLKQELAILQPRLLLVVGLENMWWVRKAVLEDFRTLQEGHGVGVYSGSIECQPVGVISVPHPSAPRGGGSMKLVTTLAEWLETSTL